jgi:hypothetical protein
MSEWWTRQLSIQLPRLAPLRHVVTVLGLAILLGACEGGSGQSGSAFSFLSVDGFSLTANTFISSVSSSTSQVTTTNVCVTLSNNLKNPTITSPSSLDNVTIQSYTLRLNGRTFTFGTAVLIPAGSVNMGNLVAGSNSRTFGVIAAPAGAKGGAGATAVAEFTFKGRNGRGQSLQTDGAITVLFTGGSEPDAACTGASSGDGNGNGNGNGGTGGTTS